MPGSFFICLRSLILKPMCRSSLLFSDKFLHAVEYAILGALCYRAIRGSGHDVWRQHAIPGGHSTGLIVRGERRGPSSVRPVSRFNVARLAGGYRWSCARSDRHASGVEHIDRSARFRKRCRSADRMRSVRDKSRDTRYNSSSYVIGQYNLFQGSTVSS